MVIGWSSSYVWPFQAYILMSVVDYLKAFFTPLWHMIDSINVPGFNVSFLGFFLGVMLIMAICSFINHVVSLNITYSIRPEYESRVQTVDKNGEIVKTVIKSRYRSE